MRTSRILLGMLTALAVSCMCGISVHAEEYTTTIRMRADQTQVQTGEQLALSMTVAQTDEPVIGALLEFQVHDSFRFVSVEPGGSIESSELSYSYIGNTIKILYVDNDAGGSPVQTDGVIGIVHLSAASPVLAQPLECVNTDVVGGQIQSNHQMNTIMSVDQVEAVGENKEIPTPEPQYAEKGGSVQLISDLPANEPSEQPTPTPRVITDQEGNSIMVEENEASKEKDITDQVLSGKPATIAVPDETAVNQQETEAPKASGIPAGILAAIVAIAAILGVGLILVFIRKKK